VRIVSLNAWGGAMFDELSAWLPRSGADVVCLQEVTRTPGLAGWSRFDDSERSLPQRADLFEDVRALLPRHQGIFLASDAGPVRGGDGRVHRQDFGVAAFVGAALPLVGHHSSFVHGSFVDHARWPSSNRPRVAQAVRLIDRGAARGVTVVHLHGLRDARGKGDTTARRAQARQLADLVAATRAADDLTVVCGDLNVLPDSETFDVLGALGLFDLVGTADTRTTRYSKAVRHASYLLVSDPSAVRSFDVLAEPEVSDHRVLQLDLFPPSGDAQQS
jgi:endonuclease/exonuclease/phosphatase family metal-dependent hydrolase